MDDLEQQPHLGAHLTTSRRGYSHHGVYVGRGRRARSRLGENDYRLLTNNCEHFYNWCLSGVSRSAQVERRLQLPVRRFRARFHA